LGDFGFGDFFFDFELLSHQADIVIQIALGDEAVLIERSQGELADLLHVIAAYLR
jgi:hypothetical protein